MTNSDLNQAIKYIKLLRESFPDRDSLIALRRDDGKPRNWYASNLKLNCVKLKEIDEFIDFCIEEYEL